MDAIEVVLSGGGHAPDGAADAVRSSGLAAAVLASAPGTFGASSLVVGTLEDLAASVDLGLAAAEVLAARIVAESGVEGFSVPDLTAGQRGIVSAFQAVVTADAFRRSASKRFPLPEVEGALDSEGLRDLLQRAVDPVGFATRMLGLARRYVEMHPPREASRALGAAPALAAFLELFRRAVLAVVGSALKPFADALKARSIRVAGHPYDGLVMRPITESPSGLLPARPEDVVGNEEYLRIGLRLARDVAAYDFAARRNPKRLNPILFGLGRSGCGKTFSAHAIGNAFLEHCRRNDIPARFLVIRRTDWASSYQNASALNLVRIFREGVLGFDGVCGVYWADIDTAFASRGDNDLRMEEKQNLGALFGLFDGTILPKNGKWFLICDANTLNMDEATISRISQNPIIVPGPTTPQHFTRLMRDVMLRDVRKFVQADDAAWERVGAEAAGLGLTGRNIESVCGNIRARIQDFDYPDEYFRASPEERAAMIEGLSRPVTEQGLIDGLHAIADFQREAGERAERERFEREVRDLVRQLNAGRAAAEKAVEGALS